jgi:hypothetical protein
MKIVEFARTRGPLVVGVLVVALLVLATGWAAAAATS